MNVPAFHDHEHTYFRLNRRPFPFLSPPPLFKMYITKTVEKWAVGRMVRPKEQGISNDKRFPRTASRFTFVSMDFRVFCVVHFRERSLGEIFFWFLGRTEPVAGIGYAGLIKTNIPQGFIDKRVYPIRKIRSKFCSRWILTVRFTFYYTDIFQISKPFFFILKLFKYQIIYFVPFLLVFLTKICGIR